ncbi:MAG: PAS domain S-box protein [Bdellovibrionales bacterium]|nr:PAS domain S-box protein [Bdellovibrionales bacterium]
MISIFFIVSLILRIVAFGWAVVLFLRSKRFSFFLLTFLPLFMVFDHIRYFGAPYTFLQTPLGTSFSNLIQGMLLLAIVVVVEQLWTGYSRDGEVRGLIEFAPDAMMVTDGDGVIHVFNRQAETLFGYSREEVLGKGMELLVPHRFRTSHVQYRAHYQHHPLLRPMGKARHLLGLKKSGEEFPVEISLSPLRRESELLTVSSIRDVTERKRAEQFQEMMISELDHRVKNILNLVLSIAKLMLRQTADIEVFRNEFTNRIQALAEVHGLLTKEKWRGVPFQSLVQLASRPYVSAAGPSLRLEGDNVLLPSKLAQGLYMVLHELSTNAAKYGAYSVSKGTVLVRSEVNDENCFKMIWQESGASQSTSPDVPGFGSALLARVIEYEFNGKVATSISDLGFECSIELQLQSGSGEQSSSDTSSSGTRG